MEAAAIVAIAVSNGGGEPPDWEDFVGILLLLLANSVIGFIEQRNAGNAVKALMQSLAPEAKVKRNGEWKVIEAAELVPGDVISIKLGDVIPADGRLISKISLQSRRGLTKSLLLSIQSLMVASRSIKLHSLVNHFLSVNRLAMKSSPVQHVNRVKRKQSVGDQRRSLAETRHALDWF